MKAGAVDVEISNLLKYSHAHHVSAICWVFLGGGVGVLLLCLGFFLIILVWLRVNTKMLLSQIAGKAVLLDLQSCHLRLQNKKVACLWSFDLFLCVHTL